jgi:hypothetical protein
MRHVLIAALACGTLFTVPHTVVAHEATGPRPDAHAPIGVMGDHMHDAGEFMLSYRYMHMSMGGNRIGGQSISTDETLALFPVAPLSMDMDMHMVGAMYAPTDGVTLMAMLPYVEREMDLVTRMGARFTTASSGIGDIKGTALIKLFRNEHHNVHLAAGLSFPTGSIGERDATPMNPDALLPYPMQNGSGTWDLMPAITYTGKSDTLSWGAQLSGVVRLDTNSHGYSLGDRLQATLWGAAKLADWLSTSLRASYATWGNVDGADPELMPMMVQTANPTFQGGERLDLGIGVNLLATDGFLRGHRLALEFVIPVHQHLDGPQMERDWSLTAGWQKAF